MSNRAPKGRKRASGHGIPDNVLALHPGALGDIIIFAHLLSRLGAKHTTLIAGGEKARLLAGLGVVQHAMDFDSLPMHELFTDKPIPDCALPSLLSRMSVAAQPFRVVRSRTNQQGENTTRLLSCFAGDDPTARLRLLTMCGADSSAFLPIRPPGECQGHLLELWCDMLGLPAPRIDISPIETRSAPQSRKKLRSFTLRADIPAWQAPAEWTAEARAALNAAGVKSPYIAMHIGAGAREKCWPIERFLELAKTGCHGGRLSAAVLILGPTELERLPAENLRAARSQFPVLECPPLTTLAGVLAGCQAYIGNDSGPSHLAAALGVPTTALFGPTNSRHFAPLGRNVRIIAAKSMADIPVWNDNDSHTKITKPSKRKGNSQEKSAF